LFNENNNLAGSLSAVAAASTRSPDKVAASNATAGLGLGAFGANNTAGVGHGYATSIPRSAPSAFFMRGDYLTTSSADAVTDGDYISFTLAPLPGYVLSLTNFMGHAKLTAIGQTNWAFLRYSADDFATDVGSIMLPGTPTADPYITWSVPLTITTNAAVEFRVYFYKTIVNVNDGGDITRFDDVGFQGAAIATAVTRPAITRIAVASSTVTISFTGAASDPASAFKLQSAVTVDGVYADDNSAVVTGTGGSFQATTTANGAARFYRVRR
jgi:hypothetical protein